MHPVPCGIDPPQVSVTAKSPVALMTTPLAVASPLFVIVNTSWALVVPTVVFPKLMEDTARTRLGVPTNPVHEAVAVSGLVEALEVKMTVAVRAPAAVGLQFTVAVQDCPAGTVPQLSEIRKSPGLLPPNVTG